MRQLLPHSFLLLVLCLATNAGAEPSRVIAAAPSSDATVTPALLATVLTSNFSPPSPDPAGIELIGSTLLISDSEVDEMSIYQGANLFETTTSGVLLSTSDTTFYSHEPTGVALNPANGHLFTSDDDLCRVFEVTPGADNQINAGDTVRNFRAPGACDWEGIAYGAGSLWIADGASAEIWRYQPGPNGVFDGGGDDVITHFDTQVLGLTDPEGIAYDTDDGSLYVVGRPANRIAHISSSGTLLRWLDTTAAHAVHPAGLACGPGPPGDPTRRLYMVARGVDNDTDPNENDGKLFIFAVTPLSGGNQPPSVAAGGDSSVLISQAASLDGSVSDDGLPNPPGVVTMSWSKVSGPGTVYFANASSIDTTATFTDVGSYVLRLTADDSALQASDEVTIKVLGDADNDSVSDGIDNCIYVSNPDQRDSNGDGYGNVCDPDLDNNGVVNINDLNRLKSRLGISPVVDLDADLDGNGAVNIGDLNRLKSYLGQPPGPSGLHP